jgi:hypothetical protein
MPAYSFKVQFVKLIEEGAKVHTIRRMRKNPTKPGQLLWLYTGMRTKKCRLIMDAVCTSVVPVKIYPKLGRVVLNGRMLSLDETLRLAVRDGFSNHMEFFEFFKLYPPEVLEFELEMIYWRDVSLTPNPSPDGRGEHVEVHHET